jgi:putative ABC transport system substrate-binding protein
VIVAASTPLLGVWKKLTSTIPIVFTQVADPAGSGFVTNYARPGGNITGFTDFDPAVAGKWLEILKEAAPGVSHVVVLFDREQANHKRFLDVIKSAAPSFQVQIAEVTAHNRDEIDEALAKTAGQGDTGLTVLPGPLYNTQRAAIVAAAARHRMPAVYPFKYYVTDGGLLYYGTNQLAQWEGAAGYVGASSRARSRAICRCRRRPNTSWSSISRPPRRSASPCRGR